MGYLHITNLYKDDRLRQLRQCYALEKIDGTSAHIGWKGSEKKLFFFSGGASHTSFVELFDQEALSPRFEQSSNDPLSRIVVYGEAYGGKVQGKKATYGDKLRFVAFDVSINDRWLDVPTAANFVEGLGLEFVHYVLCSTDLEVLDAERDADSVQAVRNGMGPGHKREGVVLRPPFEIRLNNDERLIAKHKRVEERETKTPRIVGVDPEILTEAIRIAEEFVTPMRLTHVLDKLPEATGVEHTPSVIAAMIEDVLREGAGEFEDSKAVRRSLSGAAAKLYRQRLASRLRE